MLSIPSFTFLILPIISIPSQISLDIFCHSHQQRKESRGKCNFFSAQINFGTSWTWSKRSSPKYQRNSHYRKFVLACPVSLISQTFERCRVVVMGISRSSRLMHRYSPSKAITAIPVPFTTHHVSEVGQPPYMMHINRWTMYTVAEKSKHFFALSIRWSI